MLVSDRSKTANSWCIMSCELSPALGQRTSTSPGSCDKMNELWIAVTRSCYNGSILFQHKYTCSIGSNAERTRYLYKTSNSSKQVRRLCVDNYFPRGNGSSVRGFAEVDVREAEREHRGQSQSVKPGARCPVYCQYVCSYRHVSHTADMFLTP